MSYNLLDEKWIPVLWRDGKVSRLGIMDTLVQAGRIRQIAASNPMDRLAVLRFLLAVLYWCKGNRPPDANLVSGDSLPAEWFSKLVSNRDCFNLLGEGKRFYQYKGPGLTRDEKLSGNYLVQEIPTGTNHNHFHHSIDKANGLCPACCAMGLLRLPLFATSGGRGKPPGINSKPPVYVLPVGDSLADTLRLSWHHVRDLGTPAWEKPDLQLPKIGEVSLLTGFTWLPRRVWLDDPKETEAACISCGLVSRLIKTTVFASIGSTKAEDRIWRDHHVIYEQKGHALHARDALHASDAAAGQWARIVRGILCNWTQGMSDQVTGNEKRRAWIVGFSTVQNDKYLEASECIISLLDSSHQSEMFVERVGRWEKETAKLPRKIRPPGEKSSARKHIEIKPLFDAVRPHVEGKVQAMEQELLGGRDDAWQRAAHEFYPMMKTIAKSLSPGFTLAAMERRRRIASVSPDMRPKNKAVKKPSRKKGGDG